MCCSLLRKEVFRLKDFQIGEVYLMHFDGSDHEQQGWRPGLVFQNNTGNIHSPNIIALPLTSSIKKISRKLPTHVFIEANKAGLKKDSVVLCENPVVISKNKCGCFLTTIPDYYMSQIASANLIATSALAFLDYDVLIKLRSKCISLNNVSN